MSSGSEPPRGQPRPPKLIVYMLAVTIIMLAYIIFALQFSTNKQGPIGQPPSGNVMYLRFDSTAGNPPEKKYFLYVDSPPRRIYLSFDSTAGNPPK